jgi:hypothetical protein
VLAVLDQRRERSIVEALEVVGEEDGAEAARARRPIAPVPSSPSLEKNVWT